MIEVSPCPSDSVRSLGAEALVAWLLHSTNPTTVV